MIDRSIKVMTFKDGDNALEILEDNVKLYLIFFKDKLKDILSTKNYRIEDYRRDNIIKDKNDDYFYSIIINSEQLIKRRDYNSIVNGPIQDIFNLFGVVNIHFDKPNGIEVIFPLQFFLQEDFFNSLKAVEKYNL